MRRAAMTMLLLVVLSFTVGAAMAEPIVVLNTGEYRDTIISHGDFYIPCLQPVLELVAYSGSVEISNALYMNVAFFGSDLYGGFSGNALPSFPPFPYQTPALYLPGGLRLQGEVLETAANFIEPMYDPDSGDTRPATLSHGTQSFSDFNLETFNDGEMAYVGYATSDLTVFGYMQIQRQSLLEWKLIGYAFDPSGVGILVQNLVPSPGVCAIAAVALVAPVRRRRMGERR